MSPLRSYDRHARDLRLLREYRRTGSHRVRDRLLGRFATLARHLADHKGRALPAHVDVDDLYCAALEALVGGLDRYDERGGCTLEAYLWTRMNGAILDELRRSDHATRTMRQRARQIAGAAAQLRAETGCEPSESQLAARLGMSCGDLDAVRLSIRAVDEPPMSIAADADDPMVSGLRCGDVARDPQRSAEATMRRERLVRAIGDLPSRERDTIILLYFGGLSGEEVACRFGVTPGRVSQIRTTALTSLAEHLDDDRAMFAAA